MSKVNRRDMMKLLAGISIGGLTIKSAVANEPNIGVMLPGKGWVKATGAQCEGDGTPLQFIPKTQPDENPLQSDIKKYKRCPYCGMSRKKWNHSRHLVHYDDGLADGTCSIHCLAISLSLNIDRGPKAIYAPDFSSTKEIKPLVKVDKLTYLVGAKLPGTMTRNSKMAFASADAAKAVQAEKGGKIMDFDSALTQAYIDMGKDTIKIRKRRSERLKKMKAKMKKKMMMKNTS